NHARRVPHRRHAGARFRRHVRRRANLPGFLAHHRYARRRGGEALLRRPQRRRRGAHAAHADLLLVQLRHAHRPLRRGLDGDGAEEGGLMGNPVVHWELMSKEPQKVAAFYQKVFDWKVDHHPEINYRTVDTLAKGAMNGINGGIVKPDREGPWPGNMLFYILVDDLAAYRKKVVAAGGKIH